MPQLVANALAATVAERGLSRSDLGKGGMDMTRLAGSSPEVWAPLFSVSALELAAALRSAGGQLGLLADALEAGDVPRVADLMARTRSWKEGGAWS